MKRIGLTGGFGSGKSTVMDMLRTENVPIVDADEIALPLVAPGSEILDKIRKQIGEGLFDNTMLNDDGSLNRQALARHVFQNPSALQELNTLMHPAIEALINRELAKFERAGFAWSVIDVPLLFESGWDQQVDATIVVWTPEETCRQRLIKQRGFSPEEVEERLQAQWPLAKKRERADYVIDNSGGLSSTQEQTKALITKLAVDFPRVP